MLPAEELRAPSAESAKSNVAERGSACTFIEMHTEEGDTQQGDRLPHYGRVAGAGVLLTHAANFAAQVASSAAPYLAPKYFAGLAAEVMYETTMMPTSPAYSTVFPPNPACSPCQVLRIGSAVFTPGTMLAPYFALLALGDLICWSIEIGKPGALRFQGDSIANLMGWMNDRGVFAQMLAVLGPPEPATGESPSRPNAPNPSIRAGILASVLAKLRDKLVMHDDPHWQRQLAWHIRSASTTLFILLVARLPFGKDVSTVPDGLVDLYRWIEAGGGATKAAAVMSEALFDMYYSPDGSVCPLERVHVEARDAGR
ncbi:hypothetical protein AT302_22805 [Pandoraea norimbergensis]|uniref:Uncharacterized protein n=2 Tax=Pandoraea norimbergensis TaxID=93219 RepID=A0ABM5WP13_9BURK|nr:hypothetical protein AT302_22805 [Pandoraea norimbergensis]